MTTTATHNAHDTTPERVLFVAFELSEKTWKLGFTTGHGQNPVSGVSQRVTRRACSKKWRRPKNALVSPKARRWCVAMKRGVKASGCIAMCKRKASPTM